MSVRERPEVQEVSRKLTARSPLAGQRRRAARNGASNHRDLLAFARATQMNDAAR
jgi:hypothetical protein